MVFRTQSDEERRLKWSLACPLYFSLEGITSLSQTPLSDNYDFVSKDLRHRVYKHLESCGYSWDGSAWVKVGGSDDGFSL